MDSSKTTTQQQQKLQQQSEDPKMAQFSHFQAAPGPVMPTVFDVPMEGTKEERMAKMTILNDKNEKK